jgi:hypothetical protein
MANAAQPISARQVLDFLNEQNKSKQLGKAELEDRQAYRHAAAVLASIDDISSLKPLGSGGSSYSAADLLGDDLVPVRAKRLGGKVMLSVDVRHQALSELAARDAFVFALAANPAERSGPIQAQFESYLIGKAKPVEQQTLLELEDTLQALLWLDGIPIEHPSLDEVRRRLDLLRMLAPFESLAGDEVFRGRRRELDFLRRYVGVIAPAALLSRLARSTLDWIKPREQPALSVFGPGGVGKSALVARFMLEHDRLPEEARIPFAYLDFDRPTLDITRPLTLCLEMIRQLHLQFPTQGNFGPLFAFVTKKVDEVLDSDQLNAAYSVLADLLGIIESKLGPRPYVVTLDTFEEVQYRLGGSVFPFWDMLVRLQKQRPFLRVVISGRAPVTNLRLAGRPPNSLEIGSLDTPAAIAFLQALGITNADVAEKIVEQVGAVPLSLKLAASLIKREGKDADSVRNLTGSSRFWFSASDEMIQGQLFERILSHIHNPQVERLAHPGLVMRRITPDVILNILNEPCSLAITTAQEAQSLFNELRNETALVMVNQDEDAEELVHRPELRRIMLKLLVQKSPAQVRDIHQRAVEWYSSRSGLRARAEELYHRLQLGEKISKRALDDQSVRFSIQASIEELPVESQLLLASYGLDVSKEILNRANREQREAQMATRIEELLPYGPSSVSEAASIADALLKDANGTGAAFRAAARVAFQQNDVERGLQIVEQGLSVTLPANDALLTLDLLQEKAWALRSSSEEATVIAQLNDYATRYQNKSAIFQQRAQSYAMQKSATQPQSLELTRLLVDLNSIQFWGLVPAVGLVIRKLVLVDSHMPDLLRPKLTDEKGPFLLAFFPDSRAETSRKTLVNQAMKGWGDSNYEMQNFVTYFEQLCAAWPYRVLRVQPPYGDRGSRRFSAAAA